LAILNYTTEIAASKTIGEVQSLLVKAGARKIMTDYDDEGNPTTISFLVATLWGDRGFILPANIESVYKVLVRQYNQKKIAARYATKEQASRVGWRIIKDWVEAQLAIIETEMVTLDQVFLPYMTVEGAMGQERSLYQLMTAHQLALPAPGDER
jgi:hypothetical protein